MKYHVLYNIIIIVVLLSGCENVEDKPLSIGINPWPGYEFLYLADQKGFYKEEKLNVKIIEYGSLSDVRRGFERGNLDAMAVTLIEVLQAKNNSNKHPVVSLVADFSNGADVILARSDIKSLADMKGRRVAADTTSLPIFMLARALEKAGLGLDDITLVPLEQTTMEQEYINGNIDVVVTYPPVSVRLKEREDTGTIFTSKEIPGEVMDVLAIEESVLRSRPDVKNKIIKAWDRALKYAEKNPQDAYTIMAKREGISAEEFAQVLDGLDTVSLEQQEKNMQLVPATLKKLSEILKKTGALPAGFDGVCCF